MYSALDSESTYGTTDILELSEGCVVVTTASSTCTCTTGTSDKRTHCINDTGQVTSI